MAGDSTRNVVHGDAGTVIQAGTVHLHALPITPTPRQIPPDVTHFSGRNAELAVLDELIIGSTRPVVISAIAGVGGVGKTALAVHWAHRVADRFPDGQLYVNLRGFSPEPPLQPVQVLTGFLTALGVSGSVVPQDLDSMAGLYRSLLVDRQVLVLLDNAANAEQVRPLLPSSPRCLVLVTSRNRLGGLAARDGAHRITLGGLASHTALSLLKNVIGASRIEAEHDAATALVRQCAGLPLALRIAAERVADRPHRTVSDLTEDLAGRRLDTLASHDDTATAVRAVFALSYQALPPHAARVFRLLGLHPGPTISTPAAAALTGMTPDEIRPVLDVLTGGHLVEEIGCDRFQFHDLIREYANEVAHLHDSLEDREACVRRVLGWYLHTADLARLAIYPQTGAPPFEHDDLGPAPLRLDTRKDALNWYRREQINLLSILEYAADHGHHRTAVLLPTCLSIPNILIGQWAANVYASTIGLDSARRLGDEQLELKALGSHTEALVQANMLDEATPLLHQMLEMAQRVGDRRKTASAHHEIGLVLHKQGHLDQAAHNFVTALPIYQELRIPRGEAIMLSMLGEVFRQRRQFDEARAHLHRAVEICRESGNSWNEALFLRRFSQLSIDVGDLDEAVDYLERSVAMYAELEDLYETARTLQLLGNALSQRGDHGRAAHVRAEALAIYESIHAPEAEALRAAIAAPPPAP